MLTIAEETKSVVDFQAAWAELDLPVHVREVLAAAPLMQVPENRPQLLDWALGRPTGATDWRLGNREDHGVYEAIFPRGGKAERSGPGCGSSGDQGAQRSGDQLPRSRDASARSGSDGDRRHTFRQTSRPIKSASAHSFDKTRAETLDWLKTQELVVMPFYAGTDALRYGSLLIVPRQAAFFAAALADLQGMIPRSQVPADFKIKGGVLFVAPPFRHTHFGGRQVVVHDRTATHQEIFAYNLYPGSEREKGRLLNAAGHWRA